MKQIIVVRKDIKMSVGKTAAQVAHASVGVLLKMMDKADFIDEESSAKGYHFVPKKGIYAWLNGAATKICVGVDSLDHLMLVCMKAERLGLPCHLVTDAGKTEFKEPTITCCAIGPAPDGQVDEVTGHLKLL